MYSHSPYLIYAIATLGALLGVVFAAGIFLVVRGGRRPRGPDGPDRGPEE